MVKALSRLRALVSGRVQGVFYRMFVVHEAQSLGICGTVRNLPDGRVEVIAEGEQVSLEKLLARLKTGPPRAMVSEIAAEWEPFEHEFDGFDIVYG